MKHHSFVEKGAKMFQLKSKNEKIRQRAIQAMFDEFKSLTKALPQLEKKEPTLINILPFLSQYYHCNIVVHETRGVDYIVYCQPNSKNYKHDWPRIDLHQKLDSNQDYGHICLISPRNTGYITDYGWICIFCDKRTLGKCHRHRLRQTHSWNFLKDTKN